MKALFIGATVGFVGGVMVMGTFLDRPQAVEAPAQELDTISAPASWIALSADIVRTFPGTAQRQVGRFYRGSDGSELMATWVEGREGGLRAINIRNVSLNTFYHTWKDGEWYSHPMKLPPGGYTPKNRLQSDYVRHPQQIQGFDTYRRVHRFGMVNYEAPSLNFLALLSQHTTGEAVRQEFVNIVLGEPEATVFLPPPGAIIEASPVLSGIVSHGPGESHPPPDVH